MSSQLARKVYQALETNIVQDFKAILRIDLIRDSRITTEEVNLAEKVFGSDVGNIDEKTVRDRPTLVVRNVVEIPSKLLRI